MSWLPWLGHRVRSACDTGRLSASGASEEQSRGRPLSLWLSTQGRWGAPQTPPGLRSVQGPAPRVLRPCPAQRQTQAEPRPVPPALAPCLLPARTCPPPAGSSLSTWAGHGKAGGPALALFSPLRRALEGTHAVPQPQSGARAPVIRKACHRRSTRVFYVSADGLTSVSTVRRRVRFVSVTLGPTHVKGGILAVLTGRAPSPLCGLQPCAGSLQLRALPEPELTAAGRKHGQPASTAARLWNAWRCPCLHPGSSLHARVTGHVAVSRAHQAQGRSGAMMTDTLLAVQVPGKPHPRSWRPRA